MVSTVTDVPLAAVTSPLTAARFARPLGVGRGEGLGRGEALGRGVVAVPGGGPNVTAHPAAGFGATRTVVAVIAPAAFLVPVATMQVPTVMSARAAIEVFVMGVVAE
jgi:hypothetical protein